MPPVFVEVRPSRQLSVLLAIMHCLALATLPILHLPWSLKLLLSTAVLVSLWITRPSRLAPAVTKLYLHPQGNCEIEGKVDGRRAVKLVRHVLLGNVLLLDFAEDNRRHRLVLLGDSVDADALRRLRVWLRMAA